MLRWKGEEEEEEERNTKLALGLHICDFIVHGID